MEPDFELAHGGPSLAIAQTDSGLVVSFAGAAPGIGSFDVVRKNAAAPAQPVEVRFPSFEWLEGVHVSGEQLSLESGVNSSGEYIGTAVSVAGAAPQSVDQTHPLNVAVARQAGAVIVRIGAAAWDGRHRLTIRWVDVYR